MSTCIEIEAEVLMEIALRENPLVNVFLEKALLQGRCNLTLLPLSAIRKLAIQIYSTPGLKEVYCRSSKKDRL
jgi:hypothetical protein